MSDNVNEIQDAYNWSISKIASQFGIDRRTVTKRIEEAGLVAAGKRGGHPVYALRDVGPVLYRVPGASASLNDPDKMTPTDRKAWFQSETERVKLMTEMGQLCPVEDVHRTFATMVKTVVNSLETIPDILERDCGLDADSVQRVQDSIDSVREHLALRLQEVFTEDDQATDNNPDGSDDMSSSS